MVWLYPVILAVRSKKSTEGEIECLCVIRRGADFVLYTAEIADPTVEIDIGLDPVVFTDLYDPLIDQYLIESFWRLEIEISEIALAMTQNPITGLYYDSLIDPALIDLFDLKLVAFNLSQRLDLLMTGTIPFEDALLSIEQSLSSLESLPHLSSDTLRYLLSLRERFVTTSAICKRLPPLIKPV